MLGILNLFYDFTEQSHNKERVFWQTFAKLGNCTNLLTVNWSLFFFLEITPLLSTSTLASLFNSLLFAFLLRRLTKNSDVCEFKKITYIMIIFPLKYFSIFYPREGLLAVILVFVLHLSISLFTLSIFI